MNNANGEMIRLARMSRGLHQIDVAERLSMTQPNYSKIENALVSISDDQLIVLAEALDYPPSFFEQTDRIWGTASPHHRKRKGFRPSELGQLEAELNIYRLCLRRLMVGVDIESPFTLPAIELDAPTIGTPDEAARYLRRLLHVPVGPIASMTRVLEDSGCIIVNKWFPHDRFDAISVWAPAENPLILLNAAFPGDRDRHTLAHELAHLVLHRTDSPYEDPEIEATAFAAEFLMPAREIRSELRGLRLDDLGDLKRRWKVSMRSLVYRARDLGELSRDQVRYMMMRLSQLYGAKREPVAIPKEVPTLTQRIVDHYQVELGYSLEEVASVGRRNVDDFVRAFSVNPRLQVV